MVNKNIIIIIAIFSILVIATAPSAAKIDVKTSSNFDYNGNSSFQGEEIDLEVSINPGNSDVSDMQIEVISGNDALVYYGSDSFEDSSIPAGEVAITKQDEFRIRTYFIGKLEQGQTIKLHFRAYPKTLQKKTLDVAQITIVYTQLGERIKKTVNIETDIEENSWTKSVKLSNENQALKEEIETTGWIKYAGIAGVGLSLFLLAYSVNTRKRSNEELESQTNKLKRSIREDLKDISKKTEIINSYEGIEDIINRKMDKYKK